MEKKTTFAFFKIVFNHYKKEWKICLLLLFLLFINILSFVIFPLLTQQINIDILYQAYKENNLSINKPNGYWEIGWKNIVYLILLVLLVNTIVTYLMNYFSYIMGKKIEINLRNKILSKLVDQDVSYYSNKKIGELLTNVISDAQIVGDLSINIPLNFIFALLQTIFGIIMAFILEWRITLVLTFIFFSVIFCFIWCFWILSSKYKKTRLALERSNGEVIDRIISIRLIKASGTEDYETKYFKEKHINYYKQAKPVGKWSSIMFSIIFAGNFLIVFATPIFALIFYGETNNKEEVVYFFKYIFTTYMLVQNLISGFVFMMLDLASNFSLASVSGARIATTLNQKSRLDPHYYNGIIIKNIDEDIIFKNVSFSYPEKTEKIVLPKFNFRFELGKSYAFVGETGAGKSTIAKLLLRFYDPSQGKIIINNKYDLKDLNLSSYLKHIGYVEQEPQILYGDIYENVKYGLFDASDEQVIQACKKAGIHKLISSWPNGYKTILGERGFILSGGQKQRLVIARMFLKNPQILILDEATSALDNIVEKEIQAKLNLLMKNRTSITIAHRLSTIKHVDHIVVLGQDEKGIVQEGKFEILIKQEGPFKKLYKAGFI